jgi:hypothetical protein
MASQRMRFPYTTPVQKHPTGSTELVRAPGPLDPSTLPETEPAQAGLETVRAMLNAGWPALLAALSFLVTNFFDPFFGDALGALQALAHTAGFLALPTPRGAFLTAFAKATLPPRVVATLDEPSQAQPTPLSCSRGSHSTSQGVAEAARSHNRRGSAHAIWHARVRPSLLRSSSRAR